MTFLAFHAYAFLAVQTKTVHAQNNSAQTETASVHRFVQGFYDWYLPRVLKGGGDPEMEVIKTKGTMFSPELRKALLEDRLAQSKDPSEVVGLDFDPFLNSQDIAKSYTVGKIEHKGQAWLVNVYSSYSTKEPAVIAQVVKAKQGWRFTNFLYGKADNLLGVLRKLKQDRGH